MMMGQRMRHLFWGFVLLVMMFAISAQMVLAQEEVAEAAEQPQGVPLLLLVLGAGAVGLIGFVMNARDRLGNQDDEQA